MRIYRFGIWLYIEDACLLVSGSFEDHEIQEVDAGGGDFCCVLDAAHSVVAVGNEAVKFCGSAFHYDQNVINESEPHQRLRAFPGRDGICFYPSHE